MSEPYLSEIRIVAFNFPPRSWSQCDGQILPINQHQSLFSLLGTTYGGDGRTTFALPDFRGRVPLHFGNGAGGDYDLGDKSGQEYHILNEQEIPAHTHQASLKATDFEGNSESPIGMHFAKTENPAKLYGASHTATGASNGISIANTGSSQGHNNMQPYLAMNFVIALQGLFPSRN